MSVLLVSSHHCIGFLDSMYITKFAFMNIYVRVDEIVGNLPWNQIIQLASNLVLWALILTSLLERLASSRAN